MFTLVSCVRVLVQYHIPVVLDAAQTQTQNNILPLPYLSWKGEKDISETKRQYSSARQMVVSATESHPTFSSFEREWYISTYDHIWMAMGTSSQVWETAWGKRCRRVINGSHSNGS